MTSQTLNFELMMQKSSESVTKNLYLHGTHNIRTPREGEQSMRKKIYFVAIALMAVFIISCALTPAVYAPIVTDYYVSDTTDLWWSGANSGHIVSGYIVPPSDAVWSPAVLCWEHSSWNPNLYPADRKTKLFETPSADWIWKSYQITTGESYTGDIVFFKKQIDIPECASSITADLFIITADNAYYFYVNNPSWSGIPDGGPANFVSGYGPTNFYYTADGTHKSGGTNSVSYETIGNLYPLEACTGAQASDIWSSIELYDITLLLDTGENWLQIVAVNEHAPPTGPTTNPAGLIYKLVVSYEVPVEVDIDVKPCSYPNSICLSDQGLLPVAILGSETFDVNQINPETINVGGVYLATRGSIKKPKLAYSLEDVNTDGYIDLIAFFNIQELISEGVLAADTTALKLDGNLYDGTRITGTDSVRVVPP